MSLPVLLLLAVPALLIGGLIVLRHPSLLVALSVYTISLDHMGRLQFGMLTVNNLLKIVLVGVTVIWLLTQGKRLYIPRHLIWFLFFMFFLGASCFYSADFLGGAGFVLRGGIVWLYALIIANFIRSERDLAYLLIAIVATALLVSVMAHMQTLNVLTRSSVMLVEKHGPEASGVRAVSTFWDSNRMGQFLTILAVFMTTALSLPGLRRVWKIIILLVLFSTFGAILLSFSRSAWLALSLAMLLLLPARRMRPVLVAFGAVGLFGVGYMAFFTPYGGLLLDRFSTLGQLGEDYSGRFRLLLGLSGMRIWTDGLNWLWGSGCNAFASVVANYWHPAMNHDMIHHSGTRLSHTYYITILAEGGLVGSLLFLACVRAVYLEAKLNLKRRLAPLPMAVLLAVVALLAVRLLDLSFNPNLHDNLLWLILGLLGALSRFPDGAEPPIASVA